MSEQPKWKLVGVVGDRDPIAYGGGFVYTDETGVYGPEMTWFEPLDDGTWEKLEGKTPVTEYRVLLEQSKDEWWFDKLNSVAESCGLKSADLLSDIDGTDPVNRANAYTCLIDYFGPDEFDQYPNKLTEDEAYERYSEEMKSPLR